MIRVFNQYKSNKLFVDEYGKLYTLLEQNVPVLSSQRDEILRAQLVMAVSAVDTFFHGIVKTGLIQIYNGTRVASNASLNYGISLSDLMYIERALTHNDKLMILENAIQRINSKDSYQSAKGIEYAVGLIGINQLWNQISPSLGSPACEIKQKLSNIIRRRNQIAHESDINPATMNRFPISKTDTDYAVDFLDKIVIATYSLL